MNKEKLILEVNKLTKSFNKEIVVSYVDFKIIGGSICCLLGANGAGKTTLLKMIVGLILPDEGNVLVGGTPISKASVGYMIENPDFNESLTAKENLVALSFLFPKLSKSRVDEVLDIVGLTSKSKIRVKDYSMGMKQRLYFAYSIINEPKILVLDEPFNGLDPISIKLIEDFIIDYSKKGNIVLLSSHMISEIQRICDAVLIIDHGVITYRNDSAKEIDLREMFFNNVTNSGDAQ